MQKTVRKVSGIVDINFFANGSDHSVSIVDHVGNNPNQKVTTTNGRITSKQGQQIFERRLIIDKRLTTFCGGGIPLDRSTHIVHPRSITGWIGSRSSNSNGFFAVGQPQIIEQSFLVRRRLPYLEVRGVVPRNTRTGQLLPAEFPRDFRLVVHFVDGRTFTHNTTNNASLVCRWDFERREFLQGDNGSDRRSPINLQGLNFERDVVGARLEITRWNRAGSLPRVAYFSGEMHEGFDGDTLDGIEVLEEKTGNVNRLSYGISSNSCKVSVLNRDRMFYEEHNFNLLRRGRCVMPYIVSGNEQHSLGRFLSEEWQLDDKSNFMSCTAYDVLYSLQDLNINMGLNFVRNDSGILDVRPITNMPVWQIVHRVRDLTNNARTDNGLFEVIEFLENPYLNEHTRNINLPYVLVEEKSAWRVLQDIANFCCAYIYADRQGRVVLEDDEFIALNSWMGSRWGLSGNNTRAPVIASNSQRRFRKVKASFTLENTQSIRIHGVKEFTYDATLMVAPRENTAPHAIRTMAQFILDKYGEGLSFVDAEWKGDVNLELSDNFEARSIHDKDSKRKIYECLSNEMSLGRNFRQVTKGRTRVNNSNNNAETIIDPDNSFNFSLPVKSRTIVNRVNVEYYVLEPDTEENRSIRVNLSDCEITGTGAVRTVTARVPLGNRVWERIHRVRVEIDTNLDLITPTMLSNTSNNMLWIRFSANINNTIDFRVHINNN